MSSNNLKQLDGYDIVQQEVDQLGNPDNLDLSSLKLNKIYDFRKLISNTKNLNKIFVLQNKLYENLFEKENEHLTKKAFKKYSKESKKTQNNQWIESVLSTFDSLEKFDKYFSAQLLRENYLMGEPIAYRTSQIKKIVLYNKYLWKETTKLSTYFSQKYKMFEKMDAFDLKNNFSKLQKEIFFSKKLFDQWEENKKIFQNSFSLNKDKVLADRKILSRVLKQNKKLEKKLLDLELVVLKFYEHLKVARRKLSEEEISKANHLIYQNISISKNKVPNIIRESNIIQKEFDDIINQTSQIEKVISSIKEVEITSKENFNKLLVEIREKKLARVIDSAKELEEIKTNTINKLDLINSRGEKLSKDIDELIEKLRKFMVAKLVNKVKTLKNANQKTNWIISFSALKHPKLNKLINTISDFNILNNFNEELNYNKSTLKKQIEIAEKFNDLTNNLNILIKNLDKNYHIDYDMLFETKNNKKTSENIAIDLFSDSNYVVNEILKKEEYGKLSLKEIHLKQLKNIASSLDEILKIQNNFLKKLYSPELEEKTIDLSLDVQDYKTEKPEESNVNEFINLKRKAISWKIDLLMKNQKKFLELKNLEKFKFNNLSEDKINTIYLDKFINKDFETKENSIKLSKMVNKEIYKENIKKINGFIKAKNISRNKLFNLDFTNLNIIDFSIYLDDQMNEEKISSLLDYHKHTNKNMKFLLEKIKNIDSEVNQKMNFLITKYNYLVDNLNILRKEFESEKQIKPVQQKATTQTKKITNSSIKQKIKNIEKNVKKLVEKDFDISVINGVGPKTKNFFLKWNVDTIKNLIDFSKKNDIKDLIKDLPGLKNEGIDSKMNRFNNFLNQAEKFIKSEQKKVQNETKTK